MQMQRSYERFDPAISIFGYFELTNEVTGEFPNRAEFLIKNVSLNGFNLISNYPPTIGDPYQISINYGQDKYEFMVTVIHSRILRFQGQPESVLKPGIVYSTGCEIGFENAAQKKLVLEIIKNDCGEPASASPGMALGN